MNVRGPILALVFCAACKSGAPEAEPRIPFHVALAPLVVTSDLKWQHADTAPPPEEQKFQLEFPEEAARALEERLAQELGAQSFVRVTLLAPDGERSAPRTLANVERALGAHADLLLECHLRFHPAVVFETDGTFILNLPTWLFLGPVSWFVDDCDYVASVELAAGFYDLGELEGRSGEVLGAPTRLLALSPSFNQTELDFIDRNGGAVLKYLPSIVIPPGFLFRGSPRTREEVRAGIVEVLAVGLADAVRQRSEDLVQERQRPRGAFYLDPETLDLRDLGGARRELHCELVLRPSASAEELHSLAVEDQDGALLLERSLVDVAHEADVDGLRYVLELELEVQPEKRYLVLVVSDQGRRQRSFTVELPAADRSRGEGTPSRAGGM